jgi:hypothetical protein
MFARTSIHAGLVVILPNVHRDEQVALFRIALKLIQEERLDMVNTVVQVRADGSVNAYEFPVAEDVRSASDRARE